VHGVRKLRFEISRKDAKCPQSRKGHVIFSNLCALRVSRKGAKETQSRKGFYIHLSATCKKKLSVFADLCAFA
jgi:hypothetical protein